MNKYKVLPVAMKYITRAMFVLSLAACSLASDQPDSDQVIFITATPLNSTPASSMSVQPTDAPSNTPRAVDGNTVPVTPDPTRDNISVDRPVEHIVQAGDTLIGIAAAYNTTLTALLSLNTLDDPNALAIGQRILLPSLPREAGPDIKLLPDSRFVLGPSSDGFDIAAFINAQPGYIRRATDQVRTRLSDGTERQDMLDAAAIVERIALEYSVDPRLLLALLEYRAGWLSSDALSSEAITHPLISREQSGIRERSGLYRQLAWAADTLNAGYYGWKFRGWVTLGFSNGESLLIAPTLNAATVALQYFFSQYQELVTWYDAVQQTGFQALYRAYFGDPFINSIEPLVPQDVTQPLMQLPFARGETWFFTGGAHGGWGSGSAWSAIDFAPPDDSQETPCYTSDYWVQSVAPGIIVRSGDGVVVLDLDNDGRESTGWTVLYLHIADEGRIAEGSYVDAGEQIGRASCMGGFSTATHVHIARKYNGEWIPVDCEACAPHHKRPIFTLGGWQVVSLPNQEYQGFLIYNGDRRMAEQGRISPDNRLSW